MSTLIWCLVGFIIFFICFMAYAILTAEEMPDNNE